jgi:peptide/nickel transport system permease protein
MQMQKQELAPPVRSRLRKSWQSISSEFLAKKSSKVGAGILIALLLLIFVGPFAIPYGPYAENFIPNAAPTFAHPFGTDSFGHDMLSQIVWGAYPSLIVALVASFGSVVIGFVFGIFAGYYSKMDGPLSGTTDIVLTLPLLPVMVLIASLWPATNALIAGMLTLFLWPPVSRAVRAQVLAVKQFPYVETARISGLSNLNIVRRVIVPEVGSIAIAYMILNLSIGIVLVTALEFLGVGDPNIVSWGSILYWAQNNAFLAGDWWWIIEPGLMISLVATGLALIGFSLEEIMNPRLRT